MADDIKGLIERLRHQLPISPFDPIITKAANALETLSAELEAMRGKRDHHKALADKFGAKYGSERVLRQAAEGQRDDLVKKVYQPGVFKCAKCNFQLVQQTLNAHSGNVTARDAVGEKCPNDGSPMWRVSYQEDNAAAWKWGEEQFDLRQAAEAKAQRLEAALKAICDEYESDDECENIDVLIEQGCDVIRALALPPKGAE